MLVTSKMENFSFTYMKNLSRNTSIVRSNDQEKAIDLADNLNLEKKLFIKTFENFFSIVIVLNSRHFHIPAKTT